LNNASILRWSALILLTCLVVGAGSVRAEPVVPDPENYPSLDEKQIGHLRHFLKLARQLPGDWSEMGDDWYSLPERSLRYQIAKMVYATGSVQFNITPRLP